MTERPLLDLWREFRPMPDDDILRQPPDVWRAVERAIWTHRHSVVRQITHTNAGDDVPTDWLRAEHFEVLSALDVPVHQLFTVAGVSQLFTAFAGFLEYLGGRKHD